MVRIRRPSTANQAGLFHDVPDMVTVTNATRFGESKNTLIDPWCPGLLGEPSLGGAAASPAFAFSAGITSIFVANASSTCWASAADNWFFAASRRCAHSAASSAELRPSIWRSNSRTLGQETKNAVRCQKKMLKRIVYTQWLSLEPVRYGFEVIVK
jgi:hypothetical protein